MTQERGKSVLSMGAMYLDTVSQDPSFRGVVHPNSEVVHGPYEVSLGGSALIFARAAVAQGMRVHFLGKAGTDEFGDILVGKLEGEGIIPEIIRASDVQTNINTNIVGRDGITYYQSFGTANQSLSPEDVQEKFAEVKDEIDFLYLGGLYKLSALLPAFPDIISQAKDKGIKVIIDHGRVPQEEDEDRKEVRQQQKKVIRELVGMSDIYLPSMDEFLETWDAKDLPSALDNLKHLRSVTVAIKNGREGAIGFARVRPRISMVSIPAFPVDAVNTVGVGDTFNAAFIKALSSGLNLEDSITYANAGAALRISTNNFPSEGEVRDFLSERGRGDL